jgi:hypothetical protein
MVAGHPVLPPLQDALRESGRRVGSLHYALRHSNFFLSVSVGP